MKQLVRIAISVAVLASPALCLFGCRKQAENPGQAWTRTIKVAESLDGIIGSAVVYRYNTHIIALVPQRDRWARCFLLNTDNGAKGPWAEVPINSVPKDFGFPAIDQGNDRVLLRRGSEEADRLTMDVLIASLMEGTGLRIVDQRKWVTTQKSLFGETGPNVTMTIAGRTDSPLLGRGILDGLLVFVPYCVNAETREGNTSFNSHYNNGIFYSRDLGESWQIERISDFYAVSPSVCKTRNFYYYLATKGSPPSGLWFSRRPIDGNSWSPPQDATKTFAKSHGNYDAIAGDDTVHLCWLDSRHEKKRLNIDPFRANYEVVYCRRRDSDTAWSKESLLSKGLLYSFSPSMSVEADKIVIAWSGIKEANDWHGEDDPNDIYYVTSKDAGMTWTKPLKVTDSAKEGVTSGKPKIVLLSGVIHLLYVQGRMNLKQESPGLTKLNQPPWPIYYQQRPFPE